MKKSLLFWLLAFILTIATAIYQRVTGPTYPISGKVQFSNETISYELFRSHGGEKDHEVSVSIIDSNIIGTLLYKRFKTNDQWTGVSMNYLNGRLTASLPHQPPAGKLEYYINLDNSNEEVIIPQNNSVVIRFKGDVPLFILIPHIIAMFLSMFLSNRTGLEFFNRGRNLKKLTYWTIGTLIVGGFILGPLTQEYAFGELWTGIPYGHDLTDNKTLVALIGWLITLFMYSKSKKPYTWALFGSLLLLVVYLIPHSVLGSELNYNELDKQIQKKEIILKE